MSRSPCTYAEAAELGAVGVLGTVPATSRRARDARPDELHRERSKYLRDARLAQQPKSLSLVLYEERAAGKAAAVPLGRSQLTPEEQNHAKPLTFAERVVTHRESSGRAIFRESFQAEWNTLRGRALERLDRGGLTHRQAVWALRDALRAGHPSERAAACGYLRIGQVGVVRRPVGPGWAITGVETCSSAHHCPVCASAIKGERAAEIVRGVSAHRERFGSESLFLVTYTIRHAPGQPLSQLADGLQRAWNRYKTRVPTLDKLERARARKRGLPAPEGTFAGMIGGVYGQEVTQGRNGWHIHRHEVLCFDRDLDARARRRLEARAAAWWAECVAREMGEEHRPSWRRGLRVDAMHDARYIAKLGLEVADVGLKQSAQRSQWDLLFAAAGGDLEALELAAEYVRAMKGRKCVQFSERLLECWTGLGWKRAATDEQLATGADGVPLSAEVPADAWCAMRDSAEVSTALELEDLSDVLSALRRLTPDWIGRREWGAGRQVQLDAARHDLASERRALQSDVTQADVRRTLAEQRAAWLARWKRTIGHA